MNPAAAQTRWCVVAALGALSLAACAKSTATIDDAAPAELDITEAPQPTAEATVAGETGAIAPPPIAPAEPKGASGGAPAATIEADLAPQDILSREALLVPAPAPAAREAIPLPTGIELFRDELSPFGRWTYTDDDEYVWVPAPSVVGRDFVPYASRGHWVATNQGWMFVSDFSWGWAPFHYGRWLHDVRLGWCWVPGDSWAPAWVTWRTADDYIGWAPLPPARRSPRRWQEYRWSFVRRAHFERQDLRRHLIRRASARTIYAQTRPHRTVVRTHNRRWYRGPELPRDTPRRRRIVRVDVPARSRYVRGTIRGNRFITQPVHHPRVRRPAQRARRERQPPRTAQPPRRKQQQPPRTSQPPQRKQQRPAPPARRQTRGLQQKQKNELRQRGRD